jgi:hypothetical protein
MQGIAKPNYKDVLVTRNGYNNDIIVTLNNQFPEAVKQVKNVSVSGNDFYQKGRAIFNYLKYSIDYKKDPAGKQIIQLPARMIADTKKGDCKSKALAAAALMYNNGFKDVSLRYTSYDAADKTPTHVYAVGKDETGKEIVIDPVWKAYNTQAPYKHKKDYKMEISVISGVREEARILRTSTGSIKKDKKINQVRRLNLLLSKVRPGGIIHNIIVNEMARLQGKTLASNYSSDQLKRYKTFLNKVSTQAKAPVIKDLIAKEIKLIDNGAFSGNVYLLEGRMAIKGIEEEIGKISLRKLGKKLDPRRALKAAKAVTFFAPRKAILLLIALNVRGLAKRLSRLSTTAKKNLWETKFGGKLSVLEGAIKRGLKKRPLFGASKKVKAIKGIGYVIDNSIGQFERSEYVTSLSNRESRQVKRENKQGSKFDSGSLITAGAGGAAALTAGAAANPGSAASIATIIAAAAPILVALSKAFKKENIADVAEATGLPESSDFKEVTSEGNTEGNKLESFVEQAAETAVKLGVIPEPRETGAVNEVNNMVGAETPEEEVAEGGTGRSLAPSLSNIPMPLIIGGAALLGFAILKGRKK